MIKSNSRRPPSLSHGENSTTQGHCRSGIGKVFQWISSILSNLNLQKKTRLTYNCAHLRLKNKKNKNKLFYTGPRDWTLNVDFDSVKKMIWPFQTNFGGKYLLTNFFDPPYPLVMMGVMGMNGQTNGKLMNEQGKIELLSQLMLEGWVKQWCVK